MTKKELQYEVDISERLVEYIAEHGKNSMAYGGGCMCSCGNEFVYHPADVFLIGRDCLNKQYSEEFNKRISKWVTSMINLASYGHI
jgi:hypothetical protein